MELALLIPLGLYSHVLYNVALHPSNLGTVYPLLLTSISHTYYTGHIIYVFVLLGYEISPPSHTTEILEVRDFILLNNIQRP